ncbi:hypothetical protein Hanom_Chr17g01591301 [Helianthus anomalus]
MWFIVKRLALEELKLNVDDLKLNHQDDRDDNDDKDDKAGKGNDDEDGAGGDGASNVKSSGNSQVEDFMNDEHNEERDEAQHQGESSSGTKHANLHQGEIVENLTRESMFESLDMEDDKFKFDIEEEILPTLDREYVFKFVNEADNFNDVVIEEGSDSVQDVPFHYTGLDDDFPTFDELFRSHNEDELRRKVSEKISTNDIPRTISKEDLREEKKRWFRAMPAQRKFKRPLMFFTRYPDKSLGDILSRGYLEDLKDIKTLPWWDVEELKPQQPKQVVKIDPNTGKKDITLHVKRPRCLKNMPLREMEQDFHKEFKGWIFNPSTCEAVITLLDAKTGDWRYIHVLDPSGWLTIRRKI